jgi:hypothetical protein
MAHVTARRPPHLLRALRAWGALLVLLYAAAAWLVPPAAHAQETIALERRVKAAFLYKFADYVTWPDGAFARPDAPLTFGVLGDEQVAAELAQTIAGRAAGGRPLAVRRLKDGESLAGIQVLFVPGSEPNRLPQVARSSGVQPLLIVSERDGALDHGSAINFVLAGDRVKFEIAVDAADKRGLKLSSRLLTVALNVRQGTGSQ